jgi:hypothetical protein
MTVGTDRYGRSLTRLLHELRWAISERNAYNELCLVAPETSWGFFSYASIALKNDMCAHAIKVLDQHREASSFWYVCRCKKECVESELRRENLSVTEIQDLADKMKMVRDKTHFHIDKGRVFSPEGVWKEANIKGGEFNKVIDGLWSVLNSLYVKHFGKPFSQPIYDAKDIAELVKVARKNGITV